VRLTSARLRSAARLPVAVLAGSAGLAGLAVVPAAGAVSVTQPTVVSANPVNNTPQVLDGAVRAIVQVAGKVIVGGNFTQVREARAGAPVLVRQNIFAFNPRTGAVDRTFVPSMRDTVQALAAAPDGRSVFVGGDFRGVLKLAAGTGVPVPGFRATTSAAVKTLVVRGDRVIIGGLFTSVNGVRRTALAAVSAGTGTLDPSLNLSISGVHNGGRTSVAKLDATPNGSTLVITGNFRTVAGQERRQIAIVQLGRPASLSSWSTTRFAPSCSIAFDNYMRDVEIDPTGRYFVVVTAGAFSGGAPAGVLCDTASRWELGRTGGGQQPSWANYTGGDTLTAVAITGPAVYVGGHQRWMNNPDRSGSPGPGAVTRNGLAALSPGGAVLPWNPGRQRGEGVFDFYATGGRLYIGHDTERVAGEARPRLAAFPLP
jgi:hypothetical protein